MPRNTDGTADKGKNNQIFGMFYRQVLQAAARSALSEDDLKQLAADISDTGPNALLEIFTSNASGMIADERAASRGFQDRLYQRKI